MLQELQESLTEERDPHRLAEVLSAGLLRLRALYPQHRAAFQPADIQFLQRIGRVAEAAEDFGDLMDDLPGVTSDGEVVSYGEALSELLATLSGTGLELRVRRELRVLQQRAPGAAQRIRAAGRAQRLRELEIRAWPCRCGEAMTLREGKGGGLYWGCSTWPRCAYTHQLTDKQTAFLDGDGV